jgi:hypothetical protein
MIAPHFDLKSIAAYQQWREKKLALYPLQLERYCTTIQNINDLSQTEITNIQLSCRRINMAFYRFSADVENDKKHVHQLGKVLGLQHLDNNLCADDDQLTSLRVTQHKGQHDYIPYTNKRLSWHTDGYYNQYDQQIHGILLHCATPAMQGGASLLLDHEILYILLRDQNPAWITALMQVNVMTIPANIHQGHMIRPARSGAVFSFTSTGQLHMRYSARLKNIQWQDDENTQAAIHFIQTLWQQENSKYIIKYTLKAGEGVICNNVLHRRTAFIDSDIKARKRLLYRGRYYDRVTDNSLSCGTSTKASSLM